jgi:hypothetical protein
MDDIPAASAPPAETERLRRAAQPTAITHAEDPADDDTAVRRGSTQRGSRTSTPRLRLTTIPLKQEKVLKWVLRLDKPVWPIEISQVHCEIMVAMYDQFQGKLDFLASDNVVLSRTQLATHGHHARFFRIHKKSNRLPDIHTYEIYHRIRTSLTLATMKRSDHVLTKLQAAKVWLTEHQWPEDVHDVVEIGWFTRMNPDITIPEQVEREVREEMTRVVGPSAGRIPNFRCHRTKVKTHFNGRRYVTRAIGVQCRIGDRRLMEQLLLKAFKTIPGKFVFYVARHHNPSNYARAIKYQSRYLDSCRVVIIEGIPAAAMLEFAPFLHDRDPRVVHVWQTNRSNSAGRFNLETTLDELYPLATTIARDIVSIYKDFVLARAPILPDLPSFPEPPRMVSKLGVDGDANNGTCIHDIARTAESTCCSDVRTISVSTISSEVSSHGPSRTHHPSSTIHPPVSYVTAEKGGATSPTSDLTPTYTYADLRHQIATLIQLQQEHDKAKNKEIAAIKALVQQTTTSMQGIPNCPPLETQVMESNFDTLNPPPHIARQSDPHLDIHHTGQHPQMPPTGLSPPNLPLALIPASSKVTELMILQQIQSIANQLEKLSLLLLQRPNMANHIEKLSAHPGPPQAAHLEDPDLANQTPPPKKSNTNATPSNMDTRCLKCQMCLVGTTSDEEMPIANEGEEGVFPPHRDERCLPATAPRMGES